LDSLVESVNSLITLLKRDSPIKDKPGIPSTAEYIVTIPYTLFVGVITNGF